MALNPDDTVCYCFHVSYRKIETFCRVRRPRVASQISECLSAGTGCGWCVPLLRKMHAQQAGNTDASTAEADPELRTSAHIEDAAAYAQARRDYLERKSRSQEGEPPPAPGSASAG